MIRLLPLVLLAACATGDDGGDDVVDTDPCVPLDPPAPDLDAVTGTREVDVTYALPWSGEDRTIPVHVWYPTTDTTGTPAMWLGIRQDDGSLVDASFAPLRDGCKAPVILYSHGSQAWAGNNTTLLRTLVRQGWIAVAPDHVDNTFLDNKEPKPVTYPLIRANDVLASLDWLENLPEGDPLHGVADTSKVLVMGHSYGGQTAWILRGPSFDQASIDAKCADGACTDDERTAFDAPTFDPRIVASVPLDGDLGDDWAGEDEWASASGPVLSMTAGRGGSSGAFDRASPHVPTTWLEFEGACHETFTTTPVACAGFDQREGQEIEAVYLQAFAASTLLGSTAPAVTAVLDGTTVVDDRVTMHRLTGSP